MVLHFRLIIYFLADVITPGQTPGQAPGQTTGQTPGQTSGQMPVQTSGQMPAQTSGQTPGSMGQSKWNNNWTKFSM